MGCSQLHSSPIMALSLATCNSSAMASSLRLRSPPFLNPSTRLQQIPRTTVSSPLPTIPASKPYPSLLVLRISPRRGLKFIAGADKNGGGELPETAAAGPSSDDVDETRGQSTLPERFRYLTKEAPDRPVRWPWLIALAFLVYAWRTVLWELANWKKAGLSILRFFGYLLKLALAFLFRFIGDPITSAIQTIEFSLYYLRYMYSSIVAFAPVAELTRIILFSSTVLAIAEAAVPNSVNSQPYLLTVAGIIGFGAVKGFIPELPFWLLLASFLCYSRFVKKRDWVSAALPSAAVLAAVGEPWVRGLAIASYLALAIVQYSKSSESSATTESLRNDTKAPVPLLLVALAIGIHIAAKWVRHRHLTWMIA